MTGLTDADLFAAPKPESAAAAARDGDAAIWTVLGEAGGHKEGQRAVASTIINRAHITGQSAADVVDDPGHGYEAWTPKKRAEIQKRYPVDSPAYEAAKANVGAILSGDEPAPYAYDSFYSPQAQANLGRKPPNWDNGTGKDVGGNLFFSGVYKAPAILSEADQAAWAELTGDRPVKIAPTANTPNPGAPDTSQADTAKFLKLHGFFDEKARPGSSQLPLMETAESGPPTEPGTWYIPREGGLRQVGVNVPDFLPAYRRLVATQETAKSAPVGERIAAGVGMGAQDVAGSVNRLMGGGLALGEDPSATIAANIAGQSPYDVTQASLHGYDATRDRFNLVHEGDPATTGGRIFGNLAMTAPFMAAGEGALGAMGAGIASRAPVLAPAMRFLGGGAGEGNLLLNAASRGAQGAIQGVEATALNSAQSDRPLSEQLVHGAELGGVLGAAVPLAFSAGRAAAGSPIAPEVADLARLAVDKYGIPLRTTQIKGVGDRSIAVKDSERISQFGTGYATNHAAQGDAFARAAARTIGEDAPLTPEVMDAARRRIGSVFEEAARNSGVAVDDQLRMDLARVGSQARELGLDQSQINALDMQIEKILDQGARHGDVIPGDVYQTLTHSESSLSRITKNGHDSFADLAADIRGALDDAVIRASPPETVDALRQARFQWKNLKTLQPLASKAGPEGYISPALLRGRVMQQFPDFAFGGGGDLGELARIGQTFLKEAPNSGTAPRLLDMIKRNAVPFSLGGGAAGTSLMGNPDMALKLAGATALVGGGRLIRDVTSGAIARNPAVVDQLIRRGEQAASPNLFGAVPDALGYIEGQAYVPAGVLAERNRLFELPEPGP